MNEGSAIKELEEARLAVSGVCLTGTPDAIAAYWRVAKACTAAARQNLEEGMRIWEIPTLVQEFLKYAEPLEEYDHMLNLLYGCVSEIAGTVYEHPRIMLRLLRFRLNLVHRIECLYDHELSESEYLSNEICDYEGKIACADDGAFDKIDSGEGGYEHDPAEWSQRWEEVIDEANKETFSNLSDTPRIPGFCNIFWQERARILRVRYDFKWRTPAEMNPGKRFDYEKYPFIAL